MSATTGPASNDIEKGSLYHSDTGFRPPIQLTPDQYEQLFLQPRSTAPPSHTMKFGNPTALGIISFLLCLTPTAVYLMGWSGADASSGIAQIGPYYFIGGLGMILAGIMEWVMSNTFSSVVFITFAGFWLSFATLNDPSKNIAAAYPQGAAAVPYNDGLMFYFAFWAFACVVYFIASLRTNIVFAVIFFGLILAFAFLGVAYGQIGNGGTGAIYLQAAGGSAFVCCAFGWYLVAALLFAAVDMPFALPLGDLSTRILRKRA